MYWKETVLSNDTRYAVDQIETFLSLVLHWQKHGESMEYITGRIMKEVLELRKVLGVG